MDSSPNKTEPTSVEKMDRKPFQYSLRTLLELSILACLACSLWAWGGEADSRTPEFFGGLAFVVIAAGIWMRRWLWIIGGIILLAGVLLEVSVFRQRVEKQPHVCWHPTPIEFLVVDSSQKMSIGNAMILVTHSSVSSQKERSEKTLPDGKCKIKIAVRYCDRKDPIFEHMPEFNAIDLESFKEIEIQVNAEGFQPFHDTLENCLKSQNLSELPQDKPILIEMSK
jgi:hypothetical protein